MIRRNSVAPSESKCMRAKTTGLLVKILGFTLLSSIASAQLYVADIGHKRIGEYSLNGAPINLSFITGFDPSSDGPWDVAVAGTNIYVLNTIFTNNDAIGTISKYNLNGSLVNASLITNI